MMMLTVDAKFYFIKNRRCSVILIYKITNNINGKIYIGQTVLTLKKRIQNYFREQKYKPNYRPISRAMNKYGFENFTFEVIDTATTKEELNTLEREYIKKFSSNIPKTGYNVELGGNSSGKHSKATKMKMSLSQKGELNHMFGKKGSLNPMSKKIIELTTGKFFESANLAANYFNLSASHICSVARGERGSCGKMVFRYIINNEIIVPKNRVFPKNKTIKSKINQKLQKFL